MRTILTVARQRNGFDAKRCEMLFRHLDAAETVRASLLRPLHAQGLTELQFFILVVLFTLEPEPASPADLAVYTAVSRAAVTEALARLQKTSMVTRTRDEHDLRVYHLRLTDAGRAVVELALVGYLEVATQLPRLLSPEEQDLVIAAAARLEQAVDEGMQDSA